MSNYLYTYIDQRGKRGTIVFLKPMAREEAVKKFKNICTNSGGLGRTNLQLFMQVEDAWEVVNLKGA